ncbi:MAG TPA: 2-C-methyl-D-erythritol 4-phosphate cytidylyltransferase, partial [bacterium]|nr:2-C-methyl-D-erythritol 4-phosphate cytidylyltransferase [bacterium]
MNGKVICIVAAGGSGQRLKSRVAKPYVKIAGVPLIVRTLRVFDAIKAIDGIVVAVEPARIASCRKLLRAHGIAKLIDVVAGGETRQGSVYNGLQAAPEDTEIVLIQDCARPFTDKASVIASIRAAREFGGAVVGVPVDAVGGERGGH